MEQPQLIRILSQLKAPFSCSRLIRSPTHPGTPLITHRVTFNARECVDQFAALQFLALARDGILQIEPTQLNDHTALSAEAIARGEF